MGFDDVLEQLRRWLGRDVAVVLWLSEQGAADGWLIDVDGLLERIDDPRPGVDQPVHYVRFAGGGATLASQQESSSARFASAAVTCQLEFEPWLTKPTARPFR